MASLIDPAPSDRTSDALVAWGGVLDQALHAAQVEVDGSERWRLARILGRLAPFPESGHDPVVAAPDSPVEFEKLLQGLANG